MTDARFDENPVVSPRSPREVMRLARLGSFHQTRLSFMRVLLRRMRDEGWQVSCPRFEIDARGVGVAVYVAQGPARKYSLVAFGHDLPPEARSDRVIATAWDATFTLFDGVPDEANIARLAANVPRQEAGRVDATELSVARANRSVRLFEHVVDRLAAGRQPDVSRLDDVGYLMRTTAVYGSGKLGAADRLATSDRPEFDPPFQIEMLTVYLIRCFVLDLVEHMARKRAPDRAVPLEPALRRRFGIGNSTGLGMAPFLLNHPRLLHSWISVREEALARVRACPAAPSETVERFSELLRRAQGAVRTWRSDHPMQQEKLADLARDLDSLSARLARAGLAGVLPWDALWRWSEGVLGLEGQEMLLSLMLEVHGALVDDLAARLSADERQVFPIVGTMSVSRLRHLLEREYDWALALDWSDPAEQARVWYVSEEKLEPRLGESTEDGLLDHAQPLCPGRDAARLHAALAGVPDGPVASFLLQHPEHRHMVRRVQLVERFPYAEIRDNTISETVMPIDLLRAKLACFGATRFDPRSDRWVRINMFQNAPFPAELGTLGADEWAFAPGPDGPE